MTFPFYGSNYTAIKVCTNGWLTFDTSAGSATRNDSRLPTLALPGASIAMFWDDLHLRSGVVRYRREGTRFILQFTNVGRFTPVTGQSFTFQVQLYPSGRIVLQYLTMTGTLTSATIGIQDPTRTIGLTVSFHTAYVHANLATRITLLPDWITVIPSSATIEPGEEANLGVTFDTTGRYTGTLQGNVVLSTNIPGQAPTLIPATVRVTGVPSLRLVPSNWGYGTVFVGYPQVTSFQIVNKGTGDLNVSSVETTDPSLTLEEPPSGTATAGISFTIPPGGSRLFNLRWSPTSSGPLNAQVEVDSDDPATPLASMAVTGDSILPPVAVTSPASFTIALGPGEVATRRLSIANQGGSDLTFSTALRAPGTASATASSDEGLGEKDAEPPSGILGNGGPDLFGYTWKDSDDPNGPAFSWFDISSIGQPVAGLKWLHQFGGPVPIGFPFPFYGNLFTSVYVSTDGWVCFTGPFTTWSGGGWSLPSATYPENLIAPFLVSMDFRGVERARYYGDGSRFVLQWTNVDTEFGGSDLTFQVVLYPNGRILMQYLRMTAPVWYSTTIGIQNATVTDGLSVSASGVPYDMHDGLAIEFRRPFEHLTAFPSGGVVAPSGALDLDVRIDATNLAVGDHSAVLDLITNDPARGLISVPLNVTVDEIPDIDVQPVSIAFPTTFVGFTSSRQIALRNVGHGTLHITGAEMTGDYTFGNLTLPVDLPVNGSIPVSLTFAPITEGSRPGSLTIYSDDPDEPETFVAFSGRGLFPPVINVVPSSISTALPPAGTRTKKVRILNTGESDLVWSAGGLAIDGLSEPNAALSSQTDEDDPTVGTLGLGGPDRHDYRWKDSDEPGGPVFSWTDISSMGTPITSLTWDDQNSGPIPIGFPLRFYGNTFTAVRVCTNGWFSFTSFTARRDNVALPSASASSPENLLAVFWDDLHFRGVARARYLNDGTRFIVQWTGVDTYLSPGSVLTFQAILYPDARIVYQYLTMRGVLNSATIGVQNASKDDGLTVAYNRAYVHENLAIEFTPTPDWVRVFPSEGMIPPGGAEDLTVFLDAAGLGARMHHGTVDIESNDPHTPFVEVPVTLKLGLVTPNSVDFDPDVLNLSSHGNTVTVKVELPAGLDPHAIRVSSVLLNDAVPALASPVSFSDDDVDGLEEIEVKFDRSAVQAILPEGQSVEICVQGEVEDVQWWRGCTTVRAIRPQVTSPSSGEYYLAGETIPIRWTAPVWGAPVVYGVQLSRDGGTMWEEIASGLSGTALDWAATSPETDRARIRVLASDNHGPLGYDTNDGDFTIAGPVLQPPGPVDGATLYAEMDGTDLVLAWKTPAVDAAHGPADRYRVMRSTDPRGPYSEAAVVTAAAYREVTSVAEETDAFFYRIIPANAAGEAP